MKKKSINKRAKWIIAVCCVFVVVYLITLCFSDFLNSKEVSSIISFVTKNSHTGLATPATQLAFNDNQDKTSNQLASNPKAGSQKDQVVASSDMPTVLFDISAQPVFEKKNTTIILLWSVASVLIVLFSTNLAHKAYKKAKLKKIKGN